MSAPSPIARAHARDAVLGALAALVPAFFAWRASQGFGFGLTPDSLSFLSAAHALLAGEGMRDVDGRTFTLWPPLFPLLLAGAGALGVDPAHAGRWIGIASAAAIGFLSWWWLRARTAPAFAFAGAIGVGCGGAVLSAATHLWSDAPFTALCLASVLALERGLAAPAAPRWGFAAACVAGATAMRHLGVSAALAGAALLSARGRGSAAWRRAMWFALCGAAPALVWGALVWAQSGTFAGRRFASPVPPLENAAELMRGMLRWLVPWRLTSEEQLAVAAAAIALPLWQLVRSRTRATAPDALAPMAGFALVYAAGIVAAASVFHMDSLRGRLGLPFVVSVTLVVLALLGRGVRRPAVQWMVAAVAIVWSGRVVDLAWESSVRQSAHGSGFTTRAWRESALLRALREERFSGPVVSNEPALVYWVTVGRWPEAPRFGQGSAAERASWLSDTRWERGTRLVWFRDGKGGAVWDDGMLERHFGAAAVTRLGDGLLVRRMPEPAGAKR